MFSVLAHDDAAVQVHPGQEIKKDHPRMLVAISKFRDESDDAERDSHFAVLPAYCSCIERSDSLVYRYIDSNTLDEMVIAEKSFAFLYVARAHVSFSFFCVQIAIGCLTVDLVTLFTFYYRGYIHIPYLYE